MAATVGQTSRTLVGSALSGLPRIAVQPRGVRLNAENPYRARPRDRGDPGGRRRDPGGAGRLPRLPHRQVDDLPAPERREAAARHRPGRVREVGARRQPALHRLSLREDERSRHRRAQVQEPPGGDARPLRTVQGLPLRELHEDPRRGALRGHGEGQRQGRALRGLPRRARHLAPGPAADAHLEDVLRVSRQGGNRLREQRARARGRVDERRPGLHRLSPGARHDRPPQRGALGAHPRDSAAAATPTRSS